MREHFLNRKEHSAEAGTAAIEFLMCTAFFLLPLLFGTTVMGLNLITSIQVTQFARDAAHLFSYGMDFSSASGQQMLTTLSPGLGLTSGGNAVVVFSSVTPITQNDCTGAGFTTAQCTNMNYTVFTRRIVVGNSGLLTSSFGTPSASIINSNGTVNTGSPSTPNSGYMNNSTARVQNFSITLPDAQYAYIAEVYVSTPGLSWWGPLGTTGVHSTFIF